MTNDPELDRWHADWQALKIAAPAVRPMNKERGDSSALTNTLAEFLSDSIRRRRFRFWSRSERNFLAGLLKELRMEEVRLQGRRFGRRRKFKGGLGI